MSLFTPEMRLNPHPVYAQMRRHQPVVFLEPLGTWAVFDYDNVKTVFSDHTRFSSQISHLFSDPEKGVSLVFSDPPKHTMLRALVSKAFTAAAIAKMEPRITALTHELLDKVAAAGKLDIVNDLSTPLPVIVIAEMLGAPSADREKFKAWSNAQAELFNAVVSGNVPDHLLQADLAFESYIKDLADQRRAAPQEDLVSALVAAEVEGEKLSEGDLIQFVKLLLVAGNETTTTLIGNAVLTLLEHPDQLALLRANPALIPSAIEEVLRFRSPVQGQFRLATQDLELGGQAIKAGDKVAAFLGSANRDENKFVNPETFDITRDPNHHVSFGHGIHFCLGAPLARLETRVVLTALLERFATWKRADNEPLQLVPSLVMWGLTTLPIEVTPA